MVNSENKEHLGQQITSFGDLMELQKERSRVAREVLPWYPDAPVEAEDTREAVLSYVNDVLGDTGFKSVVGGVLSAFGRETPEQDREEVRKKAAKSELKEVLKVLELVRKNKYFEGLGEGDWKETVDALISEVEGYARGNSPKMVDIDPLKIEDAKIKNTLLKKTTSKGEALARKLAESQINLGVVVKRQERFGISEYAQEVLERILEDKEDFFFDSDEEYDKVKRTKLVIGNGEAERRKRGSIGREVMDYYHTRRAYDYVRDQSRIAGSSVPTAKDRIRELREALGNAGGARGSEEELKNKTVSVGLNKTYNVVEADEMLRVLEETVDTLS